MVKASPPKERGGLRLSFFVGVGVGVSSSSLGALECPLRRDADLDPTREGKGGGRRCENSPTHMVRWATQQEQQQPQGGGGQSTVVFPPPRGVVLLSSPSFEVVVHSFLPPHLLGRKGGADAPSVLMLLLSPSLCLCSLFASLS